MRIYYRMVDPKLDFSPHRNFFKKLYDAHLYIDNWTFEKIWCDPQLNILDNAHICVAYCAGNLVGVSYLERNKWRLLGQGTDAYGLLSLFVLETYRKQGLALKLAKRVLAKTQANIVVADHLARPVLEKISTLKVYYV